MTKDFVFYVDSGIFNINNFEDANMPIFVKKIELLFDTARQLKAKVWYADADIQKLTTDFDDLDEFFTQSQGNRLQVLLEDFSINKQINHCFKVHFADENTSLESFPIPAFHSNSILESEKVNILISSDQKEKLSLLFIKSNTEFHAIQLNTFDDSRKIWQFINDVAPKRKYNFSSKHGNSTTKANPPKPTEKASQLKCSNEQAQTLLDSAIFDLRESHWCFNFDESHKTFIVFPFEGNNPSNQFHAFHIEHNEWEKMVPITVRKYFGK